MKHKLTNEEVLAEFAKHPKWDELISTKSIVPDNYVYVVRGDEELIRRTFVFLDWYSTDWNNNGAMIDAFLDFLLMFPANAIGELDVLRLFDTGYGMMLFGDEVPSRDAIPDFILQIENDFRDVLDFGFFMDTGAFTWFQVRNCIEVIREKSEYQLPYVDAFNKAKEELNSRNNRDFNKEVSNLLKDYRSIAEESITGL